MDDDSRPVLNPRTLLIVRTSPVVPGVGLRDCRRELLPQKPEELANVLDELGRLLQRGEVTAQGHFRPVAEREVQAGARQNPTAPSLSPPAIAGSIMSPSPTIPPPGTPAAPAGAAPHAE